MAIGSLALVGGTADDISRYNNWMERRLSDISPSLVERHVWDDAMMTRIFGHPWLAAQFSRQALAAPVEGADE